MMIQSIVDLQINRYDEGMLCTELLNFSYINKYIYIAERYMYALDVSNLFFSICLHECKQ